MKSLLVLFTIWELRSITILIASVLMLPVITEGKSLFKYSKEVNTEAEVSDSKSGVAALKSKTTKLLHKVTVDTSALELEKFDIELGINTKMSLKRVDKEGDVLILSSVENPMDGAVLIVHGENITGSVKYGKIIYSIDPTGNNGEHLLVEKDMSKMKECATHD